jgi:serine/threonine-protein kinase
MGTVFLAEHTLIKRRVAIKILHPELATDANVIERFMNEARAAGTLGHPNIVESTDMGFTTKHVPYIVFEYLEGTLLTDEIYRVRGLPVRRAVKIAQQIASALHAAHNAGIVHRDLKSDNIFLTDKDDELDRVKVLDFGISRFLEAEDEQTRRGMIMGTPEFMAPEQITAPQDVDRRADVWALGVILYEMLTARRPFSNDDNPQTLLHRIVHNATPPLQRAEVPHGLGELILTKLLAKDPNDRLQSMVDVESALMSFSTLSDARGSRRMPRSDLDLARNSTTIPRPTHGVQAGDASSVVGLPPPPPRRSPMMLYGMVGVGLLVGAGGLAVGLRGGSHAAEPAKVATAPAPLPAAAMPAPAPAVASKVDVQVLANVPGARVTFRRHVAAAPSTTTVTANDIVELVEVSAPGYKTTRYWLTIDRPTRLAAKLVRGDGMMEASEEQTLVALGELPSTPAIARAAPATVAASAPTAAAHPAAEPEKSVAKPAAAVATSAEAPKAEVAKPEVVAEAIKPTPRKIGRVDTEQATPAAAVNLGASANSPAFAAVATPPAPKVEVPVAKPEVVAAVAPKAEAPKVAQVAQVAQVAKATEPTHAAAPVEAAPAAPQAAPAPAAIDTGAIQRAISGHRADVTHCFDEGKKKKPDLSGTITLALGVDGNGKVHRVQVSSTLNSPLVAGCVVKAANGWQLPGHPGSEFAQVSFPFSVN